MNMHAQPTVSDLIDKLNLVEHPEGGYYAETYRAKDLLKVAGLPDRFGADRSASTAIYFLLPAGTFSALHRIKSDEGWHFYAGAPLRVHMLSEEKEYYYQDLGSDLAAGQTFQYIVPHGVWFGAEPLAEEGYSLVGCTVAPGFDFADFEMGKAKKLSRIYPNHTELIQKLCRE